MTIKIWQYASNALMAVQCSMWLTCVLVTGAIHKNVKNPNRISFDLNKKIPSCERMLFN